MNISAVVCSHRRLLAPTVTSVGASLALLYTDDELGWLFTIFSCSEGNLMCFRLGYGCGELLLLRCLVEVTLATHGHVLIFATDKLKAAISDCA